MTDRHPGIDPSLVDADGVIHDPEPRVVHDAPAPGPERARSRVTAPVVIAMVATGLACVEAAGVWLLSAQAQRTREALAASREEVATLQSTAERDRQTIAGLQQRPATAQAASSEVGAQAGAEGAAAPDRARDQIEAFARQAAACERVKGLIQTRFKGQVSFEAP